MEFYYVQSSWFQHTERQTCRSLASYNKATVADSSKVLDLRHVRLENRKVVEVREIHKVSIHKIPTRTGITHWNFSLERSARIPQYIIFVTHHISRLESPYAYGSVSRARSEVRIEETVFGVTTKLKRFHLPVAVDQLHQRTQCLGPVGEITWIIIFLCALALRT